MSSSTSNCIISSYVDGVRTITLHQPDRKNAMSPIMYQTVTKLLNEDATDDKIVVTIITGAGNYFTSGNDFKSVFLHNATDSGMTFLKDMVNGFINYPKLLIAVVNGPAIGIGATMSALCDIVYATDKAVFETPFITLGLCAEAASSFTFPYYLGRSKASEMLLLNHKLSAEEAYQFGLVSKVIPHSALNEFIIGLQKYGQLPIESLKVNKKLIMANFKPILCECNDREIEQVLKCIEGEDFANAMQKFFDRKNKL